MLFFLELTTIWI